MLGIYWKHAYPAISVEQQANLEGWYDDIDILHDSTIKDLRALA
ncbi:MAG: hypothetical protein QM784_33510 [Polyangiaceae bacterium]